MLASTPVMGRESNVYVWVLGGKRAGRGCFLPCGLCRGHRRGSSLRKRRVNQSHTPLPDGEGGTVPEEWPRPLLSLWTEGARTRVWTRLSLQKSAGCMGRRGRGAGRVPQTSDAGVRAVPSVTGPDPLLILTPLRPKQKNTEQNSIFNQPGLQQASTFG